MAYSSAPRDQADRPTVYEGGSLHAYSVSNTAEYGDLTRDRASSPKIQDEMRQFLTEIPNGEFARRGCGETRPTSRSQRPRRQADHSIEEVVHGSAPCWPDGNSKIVDKPRNDNSTRSERPDLRISRAGLFAVCTGKENPPDANSSTPVAMEGIPFILGVPSLPCSLLLHWLLPALAALCTDSFHPLFFQEPARTAPGDENAVLAPADGKVLYLVMPSGAPGAGDDQVSISCRFFNVLSTGCP